MGSVPSRSVVALGGFSPLPVTEAATQTSPFAFVKAAPYARCLIGAEAVLEAGFPDGAGGADLLGLAGGGFVFGCRKEQIAIDTGARRVLAPIDRRFPHDIAQSQQTPAFLSANPYNAYEARDNPGLPRFSEKGANSSETRVRVLLPEVVVVVRHVRSDRDDALDPDGQLFKQPGV